PLPVALRLWQHTRLNNGELAPTSEGITPSQAAQKLSMSVQGRAGTNDDARADVEGAVSKDADPFASGRPTSRLIKCADAEPRQGLKMLGIPCQSVIRPPLPQGLVGLMSFDLRGDDPGRLHE